LSIKNKKILIGITGAIAAYKIAELIRMFKRQGADVKVVLTPNALNFVTIKTLETLSGNPVYVNQFEEEKSTVHISLENWADIFVLAPLSANTLSKIANSVADNLFTSVACAILGTDIPVVLVPSMNVNMWENPYFKENLDKLQKRCIVIEPEEGFLACNAIGKGRLPEVQFIFDKTVDILEKNQPLKNKKIIITAGGTKEQIDPVRYISNASSGKMGLALADCAYNLGADVHLICSFDVKKEYKVTKIQTAMELKEALDSNFNDCDCLIMAAAVADYRIKDYNENKISSKNETLTLELVKNPDILKDVCMTKRENQTVIGFCLATEDLIEKAKEKISNKKCDFIIANEAKTALGKDENEVWIIDKNSNIKKVDKDSKENIAKKILELIYD